MTATRELNEEIRQEEAEDAARRAAEPSCFSCGGSDLRAVSRLYSTQKITAEREADGSYTIHDYSSSDYSDLDGDEFYQCGDCWEEADTLEELCDGSQDDPSVPLILGDMANALTSLVCPSPRTVFKPTDEEFSAWLSRAGVVRKQIRRWIAWEEARYLALEDWQRISARDKLPWDRLLQRMWVMFQLAMDGKGSVGEAYGG